MVNASNQESAVDHNQRVHGSHTLEMYKSTVGAYLNPAELAALSTRDSAQNNSPTLIANPQQPRYNSALF